MFIAHVMNSTFQILFYALRPGFVRTQTFTQWHFVNLVTQLVFDYALVKTFGARPLIYLLMSSFFAGSLHPLAGHFIAEHYIWDGLHQETYSYYGPLNIFAYNVRDTSCTRAESRTDAHYRLGITTNTMTSPLLRGRGSLRSVPSHQSFTTPSLHIPRGQWSS